MKALFYPKWNSLEVVDLPAPAPGPGEVLVQVQSCGICGSELETFRSRSPRRMPPLIMGHEFCGVITQAGPGVTGWKEGDQVISHAVVHCGTCRFCRDGQSNLCASRQIFGMDRAGGFAEYVVVPERVLFQWPATLSAREAALAEPLANGVNALQLDPFQPKDRVIVIGAGPIGLMCLLAAQVLSQSSVIVCDLIEERLEVARRLGAIATFSPKTQDAQTVVSHTWGEGMADYVIDAVGSGPTKRMSLDLVRPGGTVVWVGLFENSFQFDSYPITLQQKRVLGSYSGSQSDVRKAISILASKAVDVTSWVKPFPLEQGGEGFRAMLQGKGDNIKGVLDFSRDSH